MTGPSSKPTSIAIGLAVVVLAVTGAWWWLQVGDGTSAGPAPEPSSAEQETTTQLQPTHDEPQPQATREAAQAPVVEPGESAAPSQGMRMVVVVLDTGRRPVPGALVEVTANGPLGTYTADDAGTCPLPLVPIPQQRVDLRISAAGFVPACGRYGRGERLEIVLRRAVEVSGRVVTAEDGSPVPVARVTLQSFACSELAPESLTDGAGRFELRGLPLEGELLWLVSAEGFATLERTLELRDPSVEVELALRRGVPLLLEVVDAQTGAPITGATIQRELTELVTDSLGRVETTALLSVDEDEVPLRVRARGYCSIYARIRPDELAPGTPLRLSLLAGVRLEGRVLAAGSGPMAGVRVYLRFDYVARMRAPDSSRSAREFLDLPERWSLYSEPVADVVSDAAGRFELEGLEPLSPWYRLQALGDAGWLADAQEVPPLGPPGSTTRTDLVVPAPDGGWVTGTLTLNGTPVQGSLRWKGPTRNGYGTADATGSFRLEGVESGHVSLEPVPEGLMSNSGCRELFAGAWELEVTPDTEARIDIALELELAPITGRVVEASGAPREGLYVVAHAREACWRAVTQTAADGSFEFPVRAGAWGYRVRAGQDPDLAQRDYVPAGTRGLELVLPGSGTLRLRVFDRRTREPLTGFALRLEGEQGQSLFLHEYLGSGFTPDPQGWYEPELRPGPWRLFVGDHPGGDVSGYLPLDGGEVRVTVGAEPVSLELERERGCELEVRLAEGLEPWPEDVHVLLLEADRCDQVALEPNGWRIGQGYRGLNVVDARRIRPDAEGRAKARALWPGACRFVAFPDGIVIEPAQVVVTEEASGPVEIRWTRR